MTTLRNVKHERFAQNIATSTKTKWSNGRCYSEAGFKTDARSADACAARLLTNANVAARIEELLAPAVQKTRTSKTRVAAIVRTPSHMIIIGRSTPPRRSLETPSVTGGKRK